jgi:hypothetical protein
LVVCRLAKLQKTNQSAAKQDRLVKATDPAGPAAKAVRAAGLRVQAQGRLAQMKGLLALALVRPVLQALI